MSFFKGKKKNWMIVTHSWHCSSYGFTDEIIVDATRSEAEAYAAKKADTLKTGMPDVKGIAIELPDLVRVVKEFQSTT